MPKNKLFSPPHGWRWRGREMPAEPPGRAVRVLAPGPVVWSPFPAAPGSVPSCCRGGERSCWGSGLGAPPAGPPLALQRVREAAFSNGRSCWGDPEQKQNAQHPPHRGRNPSAKCPDRGQCPRRNAAVLLPARGRAPARPPVPQPRLWWRLNPKWGFLTVKTNSFTFPGVSWRSDSLRCGKRAISLCPSWRAKGVAAREEGRRSGLG